MSQQFTYYKHSGTVGQMGIIYMILIGLAGTAVLSAIYGYAIFYIPFIYLNFLITFGFGGILGILISRGAKWGKVRNTNVLYLFGFIFGLLAEYAGWVSWFHAYSRQEVFLTNPSDMLSLLGVIAEKGAWTISGWAPTGAALYTVWAVEGLMIILGCTLTTALSLSGTPFCEKCDRWVEEKDTVFPLEPIEDPEKFKSLIEQGNLSPLLSLKKTKYNAKYYTRVDLIQCSKCQSLHLMTVIAITTMIDKKGEEKEGSTTIMESFVIDSQSYGKIRSMGK